jgi:hypothetical protein
MSPEDREIMQAAVTWSFLKAANELRVQDGKAPLSADQVPVAALESMGRMINILLSEFPGYDFRETALYEQYKAHKAH